jgi:hypothetical protein
MKGNLHTKLDAMAIAIDWLDAYRSGDVDAILELFADDASIECRCGGFKSINGREALKAYLVQYIRQYPATELDDLQPACEGAVIAYISPSGTVRTTLIINARGKIHWLICGLSTQVSELCE